MSNAASVGISSVRSLCQSADFEGQRTAAVNDANVAESLAAGDDVLLAFEHATCPDLGNDLRDFV